MAYEVLKEIIDHGKRIMVFSGMGMVRESGISYFRDEPYAYEVEARYGISPEEFLSAQFFSSRPGPFYQFYKNEVLTRMEAKPNAAHFALVELEKRKEAEGGKVTIATRSICNLHQIAGAKNVIELCGDMYENHCMRCGKKFSAEYIKQSKGIPHCDDCQGMIRPGILLAGEMLNNTKITEVANETEKADILLVVGTHLDAYMTKHFRNYYKGSHLILINDESHPTDREADMVIYEKACDVLPRIMEE